MLTVGKNQTFQLANTVQKTSRNPVHFIIGLGKLERKHPDLPEREGSHWNTDFSGIL